MPGSRCMLTYRLVAKITDNAVAFWAALDRLARHTCLLLQPPRADVRARDLVVRRRGLPHRLVSHARRGGTWRGWVALGALGGLVAMIREQDAVFLLVPAVDEALRLLPGVRRPQTPWLRDCGANGRRRAADGRCRRRDVRAPTTRL